MPTPKQIALSVKKKDAERKRDIIQRVTSAVIVLMHESQLYDSVSWPKHGFIAGYGGEFTKHDTIALGVSIGSNAELNKTWQLLNINIIQKSKKRAYEQAEAIDLILDCSFQDGVYFICSWPIDLPSKYRYKYREWPYKNNWYYSQIQFTFTLTE